MLSPVPAGPPKSKCMFRCQFLYLLCFLWVLPFPFFVCLSACCQSSLLLCVIYSGMHLYTQAAMTALIKTRRDRAWADPPCVTVLNIPSPVEKPPPPTLNPCDTYTANKPAVLIYTLPLLNVHHFSNVNRYVIHTPRSPRERDQSSSPTKRCPEDTWQTVEERCATRECAIPPQGCFRWKADAIPW